MYRVNESRLAMKTDAARPDVSGPNWTGKPAARSPAPAAKADAAAKPTDTPPADAAALEAARRAANRVLNEKDQELAFEFDDELNRVVAKLIDKRTREVIRQVPSEAILSIARALAEGARAGIVVRVRA